jgi:hypothetical protein
MALVSGVAFVPVLVAAIFARVSAEGVRPIPATDILALVSGLGETFPCARRRFQVSRDLAPILALVSSLRF